MSRRGRPRSYDPERALDAAMAVFWSRGYAATTLDTLSAATGMQRPSLYAAFGDKGAIFAKALDRFQARMRGQTAAALQAPRIDDALQGLLMAVIDVYAPVGEQGQGCLVFGVASVDAAADSPTRAAVAAAIDGLDGALRARLEVAIGDGALPADADARVLAQLVSSLVHGLSLRARAGADRRTLRRFARDGAAMVLAAGRARR